MPVKRVSVNYSGRKKDLNIAYKINPANPSRQTVDLRFGHVSSFVAGPQKLIQRYMIALCTAIGSQTAYPAFGTDLIGSIGSSNRRVDSEELKHIFNFANWKVVSEFREYQKNNPDLPEDEQLNTAILDSFTIEDNRLKFKVKILTMAGEDVDFLLPLPIVK